MRPRSRRPRGIGRVTAGAFLLVLVLVLPSAVVPFGGPSDGAGFPPKATDPAARLSGLSTRPDPVSAGLSTQFTLGLENHTLLRGNVPSSPFPSPMYEAYDAERNLLYLSNGQSDQILELDPSTFEIVGSLDATGVAGPMVYVPSTQQLWIESVGSVLVISPATDRFLDDFPIVTADVGAFGLGGQMDYLPAQNELFIAGEYGSSNATIFSLATDSVVTRVVAGYESFPPGPSAYDPVTHLFYCEDPQVNTLQVFDPLAWRWDGNVSLQNQLTGGFDGLGIDSTSGDLYVSTTTGLVARIAQSNHSLAASRSLGSAPTGIAFDPQSNQIFVADRLTEALYALSPLNLGLRATIPLVNASQAIPAPWLPLEVPTLGTVFVDEGGASTISGVDAATDSVYASLVTDPDPGFDPSPEVWDPACRCDAVGVPGVQRVEFVNASRLQVISSAWIPGTPSSMLYDGLTQELVVSLWGTVTGSAGVAFLNASTGSLVGLQSGVRTPGEAALDPTSGVLFVPQEANSTVDLLSAPYGGLLATVPGGQSPEFAVYAPGPNEVIVGGFSDNVSVLNAGNGSLVGTIGVGAIVTSLAVDPVADRLYVGTGGNVSIFSLATDVRVGALAVPGATTIALDPGNGTAFLTNASGRLLVASLAGGTVIGIPFGTQGPGGVGRESLVEMASGAFLVIAPFSAALYEIAPAPPDLLSDVTFVGSPAVLALGGSISFDVGAPVVLGPFHESYDGLPGGCPDDNVSDFTCAPSAPGAWGVEVTVTDPAGQSLSRSLRVWVVAAGYSVTVNQTGLPASTEWWFNVTGGASFEGTGAHQVFAMLNGSYSYSLATIAPGWSSAPGAFVVDGSPIWVLAPFAEELFLVTVSESGLASGTLWTASIGAASSAPTAAASVRFSLGNGSYRFNASVVNATGWLGANGSFSVADGPVGVAARFSPVVPTISQFSADPNPVWVGGSTNLSVSASAAKAPLTYRYSGLPGSCDSVNRSEIPCAPKEVGAYAVGVEVLSSAGGQSFANLTLTVNLPPPPPAPTSVSPWIGIGTTAVIAAVVLIGVAFLVRRRRSRAPADPSPQ